jgi:hypothetical protein
MQNNAFNFDKMNNTAYYWGAQVAKNKNNGASERLVGRGSPGAMLEEQDWVGPAAKALINRYDHRLFCSVIKRRE